MCCHDALSLPDIGTLFWQTSAPATPELQFVVRRSVL